MAKCPAGGHWGVCGVLHIPPCSLHFPAVPERLRDLPSSANKAEQGLGQKTIKPLRDFLPACSQVCIELNMAEFFNQTWRKLPEQGTISCKQSIPWKLSGQADSFYLFDFWKAKHTKPQN